MRIRIIIFCSIILAICLWLLLRRAPEQSKTESPTVQVSLTNQAIPARIVIPSQPSTSITKSISKPGMELYSQMRSNLLSPERKMRLEQLQEAWRTPIRFYGMIVDQSNNPVSRADIRFDCNDLSEKGTSFYDQKSDINGMFSLTDVRGEGITVHISKEGYYASRRDRDNFEYAQNGANNFIPNAGNPVVFHLWKKRDGASLIEKDFPPGMGQIWQLHHDGTLIKLDLLNGSQNVTGNGQLKLEFWRDLSDRNANKFNWKLQVSAFGGGIIPTDEEFAFQAPESGYQPSVVIDMPATNKVWLGELRAKYYIQLPNGNYGRFDLYLLPYNGAFTVHSVINPIGSRDLEPK